MPWAGCVEPSPHLGLHTSHVVAARPAITLLLEAAGGKDGGCAMEPTTEGTVRDIVRAAGCLG